MKYQVFQDGKPADSQGYPTITGDCWKNSIFDSFEEAVIYTICWAYPMTKEEAKKASFPDIKLNTPINMSMGEFPVMMEIREINDIWTERWREIISKENNEIVAGNTDNERSE